MKNYYFFVIITLLVALSCKKSSVDSDPNAADKYEVSTLKSAKNIGVLEGDVSQVNLDNINSMVTDSKGNIYMADWNNKSVKVMTPQGKITQLKVDKNINMDKIWRMFISNDDELFIISVDQQPTSLFYYSKNGEAIRAFLNKIDNTGEFNSLTYLVKKTNDNKILVFRGGNVYKLINEKESFELKDSTCLESCFNIGNDVFKNGNEVFVSSNGTIYHITNAAANYFFGNPSDAKITILDENYKKTYLTSIIFQTNEKIKFNFGDGVYPNIKIGNIVSMCGDKESNIFIVDFTGNSLRLRKISKDGRVKSLAGGTGSGNLDGIGSKASFAKVRGMTVDLQGNIYISTDDGIRKITKK
jgi:hypothetical protein